MGCIKNEPVEQFTSADAENLLPADTINLLWYIWETECNNSEAVFILSCETEKQKIAVVVNGILIKSLSVTLDNPVNADVLITIPRNRFIMEIKA